MRLSFTLALAASVLLLSGAGGTSPETTLAEAEAALAKSYAASQEKLGTWCLEQKLFNEARGALQEALLWDGRNAKVAKALAELPAEPPPDETKLTAELAARHLTLDKAQVAALTKLAQQAVQANAFAMARRLGARARALQTEIDLNGVGKGAPSPAQVALDKALATPQAVAALKLLDERLAKATGKWVLVPPEKDLPGYVLELPKDYEAGRRIPIYFHVDGGGGNPSEAARVDGQIVDGGFALVAPNCPSADGAGNPEAECLQLLRIVDRLCNDLGLDRERVFLCGHSGAGRIAYTMIDKHRDRLRGVIPLGAVFAGGLSKCPRPDPFPIYVLKGEKDSLNGPVLDKAIPAALEALKQAQFTHVKYELVPEMDHVTLYLCSPQRLAWCQDVLAFK